MVRRWTLDDWSGFAMLLICFGVALPVLLGVIEPGIPVWAWAVIFAAMTLATLGAAGDWDSGVLSARVVRWRRVAYAVAVSLGCLVVLTAPQMGLLPILLVTLAAIGPGLIPMRVNLGVIALNTVVIVAAQLQVSPEWGGGLIVGGFYFLIQIAAVFSVTAFHREQRMRADLSEAHVELQAASVLLGESARNAERLRIARELHDLVGHQLTVLTLELEAARHREGEQARGHVESADALARELLSDVRSTVGELRDGPVGDLTETLRSVARDVPGLDVDIVVEDGVQAGPEVTGTLVRALQEAITNALRHAEARELRVSVVRDGDRIRLVIRDDGRGVDSVVPGNGLIGLRERFREAGGDAGFDGSDGFAVDAWVPLR